MLKLRHFLEIIFLAIASAQTNCTTCSVGVCCTIETEFCCDASVNYQFRCCPRWTLCCSVGSSGCCTPKGSPWDPSDSNVDVPSKEIAVTAKENSIESEPQDEATTIVYALFLEGTGFKAITINIATGAIVASFEVQGFNNYNEPTRVFSYDPNRQVFYTLQSNFSTNPESNLTLYTIDPSTGKAKATPVQGTNNFFPTGYYYQCSLDQIFVATQSFDNQNTAPYTFYSINPTTAVATFLSTSPVSGGDPYSGWFHAISLNGKTSYRLGYLDVLTHVGQGLGICNIGTPTATSSWNVQVPVLPNHQFYQTGSIFPLNTTNTFLSLSERTGAQAGFDLVQWTLGGVATLKEEFEIAEYTPRYGGYIAESLSCDLNTYAGALYLWGVYPYQDQWMLSIANLTTGPYSSYNIRIGTLGQSDYVSGVGLPITSTTRRVKKLQ